MSWTSILSTICQKLLNSPLLSDRLLQLVQKSHFLAYVPAVYAEFYGRYYC